MSYGSIYKYKARINIYGSKQVKGVHYEESWAAVASWTTILTILTLRTSHNWHTMHIDFVQSFPQEPVDRTILLGIYTYSTYIFIISPYILHRAHNLLYTTNVVSIGFTVHM